MPATPAPTIAPPTGAAQRARPLAATQSPAMVTRVATAKEAAVRSGVVD